MKRPGAIDRPGKYLAARLFFYRQALPGQHRFIDGGDPLNQDAVHRNSLTGPHHQHVPDADLLRRDFNRVAVTLDAGSGRLQLD